MIATTTQLNTPGPDLAALDGVHALTDVTGFGLAGHALELARGAGLAVAHRLGAGAAAAGRARAGGARLRHRRVGPQLGRLRRARSSCRAGFDAGDQALLTDPQTSGGLLVSCAPARSTRCWRCSAATASAKRP